MAAPVLQFKRGLLTNLPALRGGEPGFATDFSDFYVGLDSSLVNNKFLGSARYWTKETTTVGSAVRLVEGTTNGSNYVALKAPDNIAADVTYTFPGTVTAGNYLTVDGTGQLSWVNLTGAGAAYTGVTLNNTTISGVTTITGSINSSANSTFSGITTFTNTTNNTLQNPDTGAVQIDGGLGVNQNVSIGGSLYVAGYSEFVGVVTFRGGTINLGDGDTDDINVAGEFISNLKPNTDATYDIGDGANSKRWRNASFSGVGTFPTLFSTTTNAGTAYVVTGVTTNFTSTNGTIANITGTAGTITTLSVTNLLGTLTGTISTATRALLVDTTTAPSNTFYPGLFVNSTGTASTAIYVDAGISYVSSTDTLALTGDVAINGGDATTTASTFNLVNTNAINVNLGGAATSLLMGATTGVGTIRNAAISFPNATTVSSGSANLALFNTTATRINAFGAATALVMGAATGIATISNPTLTLPNATTVNVNGANPVIAGSSTGILSLFNTNLTKVNAFQAATDVVLSATTGITTIRNKLNVVGNLEIDGNNIQSSTGATVITLSGATASFASDVSVGGNLYVNGSTTQVNTSELAVYDRTITLGIQTGTTPATTTWDLGILMNYGDAGIAKTSAVIWEYASGRFQFAANANNPASSSISTPQIAVSTFAPIEVSELWVNNACVSNTATRIVGCTGSTLLLENITIDAGSF